MCVLCIITYPSLWRIFIYTYIHPTSHCSIFRNDSLSRGTFFSDSLTHLNVCNKFNLRKILSWLTLWYLTMLYFCLLCKTLIWKQLSHLTLHICICICNISHHIKIISHLILSYFYPNLHCYIFVLCVKHWYENSYPTLHCIDLYMYM